MRRGLIRVFRRLIQRKDDHHRYRRSLAGMYVGVSFETYMDAPDYYDAIAWALRNGRALQRLEGSEKWAIVG
ncbi:MAG: hypothetical protein HPY84_02825 [Syntrophobacteraceae bacterium]|jgi:putative lipoic acid-binding regulatory protein|nr:hypothetical protein [Syntrophobacteraceae bacterium]